MRALVRPAPKLAARDVLRAPTGLAPSFAWIPPASDEDDWSLVGWGTAARVDGAGAARFDEVRAGASRLFERIEDADLLPFAPRLFGGFAFDAAGPPGSSRRPSGSLSAAWSAFGDASFVLPHILYATARDRAVLAAFAPAPDARATSSLLDRIARALEPAPAPASAPESDPSAPASGPPEPGAPASGPFAVDAEDRRAWIDLVTRALAEIDRGTFEKVVLSRTHRVPLAALAAAPAVSVALAAFAHLEPRHPACARFLVAREAATFLGATPERLLSVRGRRAFTDALAGSISRRAPGTADPARAELLASAKDRAEHAFVVDAIRAALAPASEALAIPDAPIVRSLAHVHHLATPITATLREPVHLLDLAARLHPTPALCGTPTAPARAFILANEPDPRGFYGGGVGWLDAAGDGTLAVAIRSALITPEDAYLHAGAGIVRGSDPVREYEETTTKERAMRDALGAAR